MVMEMRELINIEHENKAEGSWIIEIIKEGFRAEQFI